MDGRLRGRLSPTPWSPPFVLTLLVVVVQVFLLTFLRAVSLPALQGEFLAHQWLHDLWIGGGTLARGLPYEVMKINLLLTVYLWVMSRAMAPRREAVQRWSLVGATVVLVVLQLVWAASYELVQPRFELVPFPL